MSRPKAVALCWAHGPSLIPDDFFISAILTQERTDDFVPARSRTNA